MPTQSTTYNSRVTDESLEKRFRDTFRAQGGSELVDDLYAQGVIVPIVDFTAAATGQELAENLQTAWDFSTGNAYLTGGSGTTTVISTSGFWKLNVSSTMNYANNNQGVQINITDGISTKVIWRTVENLANYNELFTNVSDSLIVFLRAADSLTVTVGTTTDATISYRQIATVNGDLVNPTGFTSS